MRPAPFAFRKSLAGGSAVPGLHEPLERALRGLFGAGLLLANLVVEFQPTRRKPLRLEHLAQRVAVEMRKGLAPAGQIVELALDLRFTDFSICEFVNNQFYP